MSNKTKDREQKQQKKKEQKVKTSQNLNYAASEVFLVVFEKQMSWDDATENTFKIHDLGYITNFHVFWFLLDLRRSNQKHVKK
jgi:hypothetical protein